MPKVRQFTARDVDEAKVGRTHVFDTRGLYLNKSPKGVVSYFYRYTVPRQRRVTETSVGKPGITLNRAKEIAGHYRGFLLDGRDPQDLKRQNIIDQMTFIQVAHKWIEINKSSESWLRDKKNLLSHCEHLWHLPLIKITASVVNEALAELWKTRSKQAKRALRMIVQVLDFARAKGLPIGGAENPAIWRIQKHLFPRLKKTAKKHHAAMHYADVPAFIQTLRQHQARATAAMALEFLILTATRTSETLKAEWSEFDFKNRIWVIQPQRMKAGKEHHVPLSNRAMELLALRKQYSGGSRYVFFGYRKDKPLADKSMIILLQKSMGQNGISVHGFRSTFKDWASDDPKFWFAREVVEECLAHKVGNEVEQAYRRLDAIQKRRVVMDAWAQFCLSS
jgi:integrase